MCTLQAAAFLQKISAILSIASLKKPNSNEAVNPEQLGQGRFLAAVSWAVQTLCTAGLLQVGKARLAYVHLLTFFRIV